MKPYLYIENEIQNMRNRAANADESAVRLNESSKTLRDAADDLERALRRQKDVDEKGAV